MSSYTSRIRLEKQIPGQNDNTWGTVLNGNVIDLVDDSIAAYTIVSVSSIDVTLTQANGSADQARSAFLDLAGTLTGNVNVIIPALSKGYDVRNSTSGSFAIVLRTATGTGQYIPQGQTIRVICDGVSVRDVETPGIRSTSNVVNVSVGISKIDIKVPMAVSGTVSITGGLAVSGIVSVGGGLVVAGTTSIGGGLVVAGTTSIGGGLAVTGIVSVASGLVVAGTTSIGGALDVAGASTMVATSFTDNIRMLGQSEARFYNGGNTNYIGLQAPSAIAANIVYDLPTADGSAGDVLKTDGAGTLSFTEVGAAIPAGSVMPYAGSTAPSGWLLSYGQAVSRTTYSALFTAISTTYGTGDGSTTFNVPDLRGRLVAGQDDMGGVSANRLTGLSGGVNGDTLGASGGAETHTLTTAELAAHTHGDGSFAVAGGSGGGSSGFLKTGGVSGSTAVTGSSGSAGSGTAHNNVQPTFILNYIIRT